VNKAEAAKIRARWARMERRCAKGEAAYAVVNRGKLRQSAALLVRALKHGEELRAAHTRLKRILRALGDRAALRAHADLGYNLADLSHELDKASQIIGPLAREDEAAEPITPGGGGTTLNAELLQSR
jgi:GrpB-like predicted nucleotidyltransferase (UPF0157 family)